MLTVTETGSSISIIPEGTYVAVCDMLIDLGMQANETYKNVSRKVLIGWQIPDETIEVNGESVPRNISKRYTMSLNENATLRADLAAWRGRDFTAAELAGFDLQNIVGAPCMINIIHKESNGKKYANISSIMALPKGMQKPTVHGTPVIIDLDTCDLNAIDNLPKWIAEIIYKSDTYQDRLTSASPFKPVSIDDGELPF